MMSDAERLNHILERIGEIGESLNVSFEEYSGNKDKQAALFAHLVIIGEAAGRLSRELRDKYPEVSWKMRLVSAIFWSMIMFVLTMKSFGKRP